jgi:hypothetical protein
LVFSSVILPAIILGRLHAFGRQSFAVIPAREGTIAALLAMYHQVIQIKHLPRRTIVAFLFGVVAQIILCDGNQVAELFVVG